jgi:subtilisin family serine protease
MTTLGFKRLTLIFLSLSLVVSLSYKPASIKANITTNLKSTNTDQMIVKLKKPTQKTKIGDFKVVENAVGNDPSLISVEVPNKENIKNAVEAMNSKNEVEYAEPDYKVKLNAIPNDPFYSKQWFHKVIQTEEAWNITQGSSDVVVAVIDDGIDPDQKDLRSRIVSPYDMYYDTNKYISVGTHGTHVAGIIAASSNNLTGGAGVAPNVKIMPINVFSDEGAYTSDIINGIYYAINQGADIISMSLGEYERSEALNEAIQDAYKSGLVIVAAAGNDHSIQKTYPASYDHVISVASTDMDDHISFFSNFGEAIDIAAPGSNILSTFPNDQYGSMSGTSMATPMVSGVAALIWSLHPNFTNAQVNDYLLNSADDLGVYGKDPIFGWGRVNAAKALKLKLLDKPVINSFSDKDGYVTGKTTVKNGQALISNNHGVIGKTDILSTGAFSIKIPKQKAGTILNVQIVESENSKSTSVAIKVLDKTPPNPPVIKEIGDSTTSVNGKAEPLSKVSVWIGNKKLGEAVATLKGEFSLKLSPQKAGAVLSVIVSDTAGNKSNPLEIIVKDKTAPKLTKVYPVSNLDSAVKGIAEANSKIIIKSGFKKIGMATVAKNRLFIVKIPRQKQSTKLSIVSFDGANNQSHPLYVTVLDRIPPRQPIVYPISYWSTTAKGKAEAYTKVVVRTSKGNLATGKANSKGYYSIKIAKQKVGTPIYIYTYDQSGNRSATSTKVRR